MPPRINLCCLDSSKKRQNWENSTTKHLTLCTREEFSVFKSNSLTTLRGSNLQRRSLGYQCSHLTRLSLNFLLKKLYLYIYFLCQPHVCLISCGAPHKRQPINQVGLVKHRVHWWSLSDNRQSTWGSTCGQIEGDCSKTVPHLRRVWPQCPSLPHRTGSQERHHSCHFPQSWGDCITASINMMKIASFLKNKAVVEQIRYEVDCSSLEASCQPL